MDGHKHLAVLNLKYTPLDLGKTVAPWDQSCSQQKVISI